MLSPLIFWILLLPGLLVKGAPLLGPLCPRDTNLTDVQRTFEEYNISATINLPFEPVVRLELGFPRLDAPPIQVTAGIQLTKNESSEKPHFALCGDSADPGPFVVVAIDPDAPSAQAPTVAQVRHFLGGGFYFGPEDQEVHALVNRTPAISDYVAPAPPAGSGLHRYLYLLFKEPPGFGRQELVNSSSSILHFNLSAFAEATELGNPLGGTFFFVAADPTS
ncbi:PEBP-like protein [Lactarius psammicola]|nr:PEBP-like protein [Lactarius psammicola]